MNPVDTKIKDPVIPNLEWHQPNNTDGCWLSIPVIASVSQFDKVTKFVSEELKKEKINTFVPYKYEQSHMSLFVGFAKGISSEKKQLLMRQIAKSIAAYLGPLAMLEIDFKDPKTHIVRGPGPWVTLHFESPMCERINEVIKKTLGNALKNGDLKVEDLYRFENITKDINPHITLGILDVPNPTERDWSKVHTDVKALASNVNKEKFQKAYEANAEIKKEKIYLHSKCIELLGINDPTAKVQDKKYTLIAQIVSNPLPMPTVVDSKIVFQQIAPPTTPKQHPLLPPTNIPKKECDLLEGFTKYMEESRKSAPKVDPTTQTPAIPKPINVVCEYGFHREGCYETKKPEGMECYCGVCQTAVTQTNTYSSKQEARQVLDKLRSENDTLCAIIGNSVFVSHRYDAPMWFRRG
jgi:hypothetical protein